MFQTNSTTSAAPSTANLKTFARIAPQTPLGAIYDVLPGGNDGTDDITPIPVQMALAGLEPSAKKLHGKHVKIESAGVVRFPDGELVPIPDAQPDADGNFIFEPQHGGISAARNEREGGKHWERVIEAAQFGQVNAYFHASRLAYYVNELLGEIGAAQLPPVRILTNAHSGYDLTTGQFNPERVLDGGHYRMRARRYEPSEETEINLSGEVHLGGGRYYLKWGLPPAPGASRTRRLDGRPYLHQTSHNPAIVYHEYAHHIVRHTADFRCNNQRLPHKQSNAKSWLDEGTCDYFTAAMLGHNGIYRWHRAGLPPAHPLSRNLEPGRSMAEFDSSPHADPHFNGTIWATILWRLRRKLIETQGIGEREFDRIALQTLLLIGETGKPNPTNSRVVRRENMRERTLLENALQCLGKAARNYGADFVKEEI
ncbi:MAG: M36 family metallopeptidase [Acidobacteriota bacterium]|nr:M36 family metallopeptidase [Acidobacteriota bacterium]